MICVAGVIIVPTTISNIVTAFGIRVLNFEVVLSLLMYIQGLSVIHFFGKAKRIPNAVTI
jgi:uncharacterized protein YybS (DUF2232 family)